MRAFTVDSSRIPACLADTSRHGCQLVRVIKLVILPSVRRTIVHRCLIGVVSINVFLSLVTTVRSFRSQIDDDAIGNKKDFHYLGMTSSDTRVVRI